MSPAAGPGAGAPGQPPNVGGQLTIILVLFLAMFILFDPNIRSALGGAVGFVMFPIVGFGGAYPVLTLMVTGTLMIMFSTILRHFFVDWAEMAKNQRVVSAFNKELRKARMENNTYKIKKLTEVQKDIMAKSLSSTQAQIKLMPVTMLVIVPIFAWLSIFVTQTIPSPHFSVPWAYDANLEHSNVFPNWILVYSLMTIPFGQVISRILKYFTFRRKLAKRDMGREGAVDAADH